MLVPKLRSVFVKHGPVNHLSLAPPLLPPTNVEMIGWGWGKGDTNFNNILFELELEVGGIQFYWSEKLRWKRT